MSAGYYNKSQAARKLGVGPFSVPRIATAGGVKIRSLPGMPDQYDVEDIDRIAAESIRIAGSKPGDPSPIRGRPKRASSPG